MILRELHFYVFMNCGASQTVLVVKNPFANAGDTEDVDSIPELGRSLGGGPWQPTQVFLPEEYPRTEEPGRLQSLGSQRVGHD